MPPKPERIIMTNKYPESGTLTKGHSKIRTAVAQCIVAKFQESTGQTPKNKLLRGPQRG